MKIKFLGAAKNVTGSRYIVETAKSRVLIDCGLYQERAFRSRNWEKFPVSPSQIDHVLLTHAHIDHSGYLPKLVKEGFKGNIYCTYPTAEIAQIALLDAAKLQEADAEFKRKRHKKEGRKGPYPENPLYTVDDAKTVFPLFKRVAYKQEIKVTSDIQAKLYDAGHILGAAMIQLIVNENGTKKTGVFSGDIGQWDRPILCDPSTFKEADFVVMESTYGNRIHEKGEDCSEKLKKVIIETQALGGNIIIPTFAIERAQELLFCMDRLLGEEKIPDLMVFLDSPMAADVTEVFKRYAGYFDEEGKSYMKTDRTPFSFPLLKHTRTVQESKAINHIKGTAIIISGSGMCTGGRIKHHLARNVSRPESTILFVGYQAEGTLGRKILEKSDQVRILGQVYKLKAKVEKINGFSAHADKDELLKWVSSFKNPPKKIFVTHGEAKAAEEFGAALKDRLKSDVEIPEYLQEAEL